MVSNVSSNLATHKRVINANIVIAALKVPYMLEVQNKVVCDHTTMISKPFVDIETTNNRNGEISKCISLCGLGDGNKHELFFTKRRWSMSLKGYIL